MKIRILTCLLLATIIIASCSKEVLKPIEEQLVLPEETYDYTIAGPNSPTFGFNNTPAENAITDHGATLGRVLFHDKRMSASNIVSCSSCHKPEHGYGDNSALSKGFVNDNTKRNSMHIVNLQNKNNFFWDGREVILEEQVLRPVSDHIEMGIVEGELVPRLEQLEYYSDLFEAAFGDSEITEERVSKALSQYLRSMQSHNSKFDRVTEVNSTEQYSQSELNGMNLFFGELHCGSCHGNSNLGGWGSSNIGLEEEYTDAGYSDITGNSWEEGVFSIPSLRNVELTGPYMHDGRFETLEDVIDHYASGVKPHENLDSRLQFFLFTGWGTGTGSASNSHFTNTTDNSSEGDPLRFSLTPGEKTDLINFIKTFTDHEFISDPRFSNPFVYSE